MAREIRILAVDDEEGMRLGMQRILSNFVVELPEYEESISFHVDAAASGEEAVQQLEKAEYDLLLLDHKMPGMTGLDVLAWINENPREELKTIMVTAYASLETAVEAMKRGAFDFLAKPFTPEELRNNIRKAATQIIVQYQARKLAEEKKRVRFEFISVLAHELKAPLGAIEGYLQILRDGTAGDDPATTERMLDRSMVRLQGMRKLIYDLLDMTRIESGTKPREFNDVSLKEIAENAIETMMPDARSREIVVDLRADGPVEMRGDASELEIIFNNLVSNAVKYNRDKGRVEVVISRNGDTVTVSVTDTGIGMSEDEAARLFKEFTRIKNAKTRNIMGTGLGLSTVRKLSVLYGGGVEVTSTPDVGTTFTVTLKADTEPEVQA